MGRVRFTVRDWVDPGACLTWQNHNDLLGILQTFYGNWFNIHTMKSMNTLTVPYTHVCKHSGHSEAGARRGQGSN